MVPVTQPFFSRGSELIFLPLWIPWLILTGIKGLFLTTQTIEQKLLSKINTFPNLFLLMNFCKTVNGSDPDSKKGIVRDIVSEYLFIYGCYFKGCQPTNPRRKICSEVLSPWSGQLPDWRRKLMYSNNPWALADLWTALNSSLQAALHIHKCCNISVPIVSCSCCGWAESATPT